MVPAMQTALTQSALGGYLGFRFNLASNKKPTNLSLCTP